MDYDDIEHCQPHLGNDVFVCDLGKAPRLRWNCNANKLYTIFFIDVNPLGTASGRSALLSQGILWWVVDVPGCNVAGGKTLIAYQSPTPLYGAGPSRYVLLAYEQPNYQVDWSEEPIVSAT